MTDRYGVVVAKFFHDTYKKRDSAEVIIDAALGRFQVAEDATRAAAAPEEGIRVSAAILCGSGSLRQGIVRHVVVRLELPDGMVATKVSVSGQAGLVTEAPITPPTEPLTLKGTDIELQVWSGTVYNRVPIYPIGELVSEVRPLDQDSVQIEVAVRYQACDDTTCLLPKSEVLVLDLPLEATDVPAIAVHMGHGQREGNYDGTRHFKRLLQRKGDTGRKTI